MREETTIFKAYQRGLLRQLVALKKALECDDRERTEKILIGLVEDTQKSLED